jgi:hypothetical protein
MPVRDRPLLTDIYPTIDSFVPESGMAYVFATSVETRSAHSKEWEERAKGVQFVRIDDQAASTFAMGSAHQVSLRSGQQLRQFWESLGHRDVYLDITGFSHHVWAPLLKSALAIGLHVMGVYVEPIEYKFSATPTEGEIFDLSERISGIAPIPGFASLSDAPDEDVCFIPLLGFEGTRLAYITEHVQPPGGKTVPVVGVPGFRPEYPFYAYHGNRSALTESRAWRNVRYAIANCPFSLFYLLQDIANEHPRDILKIAPIGTKPHALGAVLYASVARRNVELVYDHPIRKRHRTEGANRVLVYHISAFAA